MAGSDGLGSHSHYGRGAGRPSPNIWSMATSAFDNEQAWKPLSAEPLAQRAGDGVEMLFRIRSAVVESLRDDGDDAGSPAGRTER